jgi:hypothetical protein
MLAMQRSVVLHLKKSSDGRSCLGDEYEVTGWQGGNGSPDKPLCNVPLRTEVHGPSSPQVFAKWRPFQQH